MSSYLALYASFFFGIIDMNGGVQSLATSANMYQPIQLGIPGDWNLRRPFYENANPALCTSLNV